MGKRELSIAVFGLVAASVWACSGGDAATNGAGVDGGADAVADAVASDAMGVDASADAGADADGGADASDGTSDASTDAAQGHAGSDLVSGGALMKSPSFTLITTTGEGPGGNGVMTSPSHQLRGGVIGASQR